LLRVIVGHEVQRGLQLAPSHADEGHVNQQLAQHAQQGFSPKKGGHARLAKQEHLIDNPLNQHGRSGDV
jgi:hypothetical protein